MVLSYKDKETLAVANGEHVKKFSAIKRQAERKIQMLEDAESLDDLRAVPGNRLETLSGDRAGSYSIRINDQYRFCFRWPEGEAGPSEVEIVDYH